MLVVVFTALLLNFCIVPLGRQTEWRRLQNRMDSTIRTPSWTDRAGRHESKRVGNVPDGRVVTAYGNICFSPEHTVTVEMYRLRDDLDKKLASGVHLDTLKWIWNRLGKTGPHGKRYIERHSPSFRDCFPPESP